MNNEPKRCLVCKWQPETGGMRVVSVIWHISIAGKFGKNYQVCKFCVAAGRQARRFREQDRRESERMDMEGQP